MIICCTWSTVSELLLDDFITWLRSFLSLFEKVKKLFYPVTKVYFLIVNTDNTSLLGDSAAFRIIIIIMKLVMKYQPLRLAS